jgi:hypothetical protein
MYGGSGFYLQTVQGDGMPLLHCCGSIIEREVDNEVIRCEPGAVLAFDPSIEFSMERAGNLKTMLFGGDGVFLETLRGNAKIILQRLPGDGWPVTTLQSPGNGRTEQELTAADESISMNSGGSTETLVAVPIRVPQISDELLVANGLWEIRHAQGDILRFGQWNNLLEVQPDGSVLMAMESSGAYHTAEQAST